jgi:hypothetical protein
MQSLGNFKNDLALKLFSVQVLPQFYILTVSVENVKLKAVTVQVTQKEKETADRRHHSVRNRQIMSQTFLPNTFSFLHYLHKHKTEDVETI